MADKPKLPGIIEAGQRINDLVTKGVTIGKEAGPQLNLAMPNWEDPRLQLKVPPKDVFSPSLTFTFGADLNWHQPIKDAGMDAWNALVSRVCGKKP